jgi:4'-phosphopantetheinyl transferase
VWAYPLLCSLPVAVRVSPDNSVVDVWKASLAASEHAAAGCRENLCAEERERADRYVFPEHRRRFIVGRGILRILLGRYLGVSPAGISFHYTEFGRPFLANEDLRFNVSHSGDIALFGFVRNADIGIDVECIRPISTMEIAARFFSPNERETLASVSEGLREAAFYRCWTRKEAYLKAKGLGLQTPLDSFTVSLDADAPALLSVDGVPEEPRRWNFVNIDVGPGAVGVVVFSGVAREVFERTISAAGSDV